LLLVSGVSGLVLDGIRPQIQVFHNRYYCQYKNRCGRSQLNLKGALMLPVKKEKSKSHSKNFLF